MLNWWKQFSGSEADDNFYLDCAADNDGSWTAVEILLIVNVNISSAIIYKDFSMDWNVASPTNITTTNVYQFYIQDIYTSRITLQ